MENVNQSPLENKNVNNNVIALEELNAKNKLFLLHMLEGKNVKDAHKLAGYSGDAHAAYMLKARLKDEYELLVQEASGNTKADLMQKLGWAASLPVVDKFGQNVTGISMANYLKALKQQADLMAANKETKPKLTMIQINRFKINQDGQTESGEAKLDSVEEQKIIEVNEVDPINKA